MPPGLEGLLTALDANGPTGWCGAAIISLREVAWVRSTHLFVESRRAHAENRVHSTRTKSPFLSGEKAHGGRFPTDPASSLVLKVVPDALTLRG
jgi:hypothetical protein